MTRRIGYMAPGVLAWAVVATAAAQEAKRLEPVVVTATKTETPAGRLGASVSVVTQEELRARHYQTLADALRQLPGVEVQQQGSLGRQTLVRIRGAGPDQVQVLVDGVRVKAATTGDFNFANLAIDQIERIEVVRGPQSSLYGADAIGGVINVVTRRGQGPPSMTLEAQGGNLETHREQLGFSGASGRLDWAFGASAFESGGEFKNDDSEQQALSGRLGLALPGRGSLALTARYAKTSTDNPVNDPVIATPPFFRLDPDAQQQNELTVGGARWEQRTVDWHDFELRFGQMWHERGAQDPLTPGLDTRRTISQINNRRREVELINRLHGGRWTTLSLGLEHRFEWALSRGSFRESEETKAAFAQDELRLFDRLFLSGGVRWEDHQKFGTETTPRAAAVVVIPESRTRFKGSWSQGFRAPTLNDLFFPGFGNPALQPERSESWDAGVEQKLWADRIRLGVTYFRQSFEDLIQNVRTGAALVPQNIGRAITRGLEFTSEADLLDQLLVTTNYTFTEADDLTNRLPLRRFARHRGNLGLSWDPLPALNLFVQANVVSSQFEAVGFPRNDGYHRVDAGGSYRLLTKRDRFPGLDLTWRVQNLTDESYMETFGFRAPGINVLVGLRATY